MYIIIVKYKGNIKSINRRIRTTLTHRYSWPFLSGRPKPEPPNWLSDLLPSSSLVHPELKINKQIHIFIIHLRITHYSIICFFYGVNMPSDSYIMCHKTETFIINTEVICFPLLHHLEESAAFQFINKNLSH